MNTSELEQPETERGQVLTRRRERRDVQEHLIVYLIFNAAVRAVWTATRAGYPGPRGCPGSWAVGLPLNVWIAYMRPGITEADVEREIERMHALGADRMVDPAPATRAPPARPRP